jgi:archaellum biogenesis protein FlaJ (TadC family)
MSVTVRLLKKMNRLRLEKRRGNTQLIQTAIALMVMIAIGAVVVSLVVGIGGQITANTPAPPAKSLLYNLSMIFNTAVGQGVALLPSVFLVGFGVLVLGAILYIWAWFGGGRGFGR